MLPASRKLGKRGKFFLNPLRRMENYYIACFAKVGKEGEILSLLSAKNCNCYRSILAMPSFSEGTLKFISSPT